MLEKLPMCRLCLVKNLPMYVVVNKNLQEIYEKLTDVPFVTVDSRPMLACLFCCTKLKQCWRLQLKCLEAEKLYAQMLNEDYQTKPQVNQDQLEFSGYTISPTVHINISGECQTESNVIKEELPDLCERQYGDNQTESVHEFKDIENVYIPVHHSESEDVPPQRSASDLEDDVPLMKFKTEVEEEQEVTKTKPRANDTNKSEHEFKDIENVYIPVRHSESVDLPSQQSALGVEDDVPLMKFNTEVEEEQEVTKTKRKANDTNRANVAKKPKIDIRRTKPEDTSSTQEMKNEHILYNCETCQRSFTRKSNLTKHIRVHTGEKPYKCEICKRSFTGKSGLITHVRIHTGKKPFKCEICKRSFTQKSNLTKHIRVHIGEKPYKCDICQHSFNQKHHLTQHIRIHTGDKPYKCGICKRSFTNKCHLTNHIRLHTGDKPYKCEICERSFTDMSGLAKHIRVGTHRKKVLQLRNMSA